MNNVPPDLIAATKYPPAATAVQELDPICTGDDLFNPVPSPNAPAKLLPQVNNNPSERMAVA